MSLRGYKKAVVRFSPDLYVLGEEYKFPVWLREGQDYFYKVGDARTLDNAEISWAGHTKIMMKACKTETPSLWRGEYELEWKSKEEQNKYYNEYLVSQSQEPKFHDVIKRLEQEAGYEEPVTEKEIHDYLDGFEAELEEISNSDVFNPGRRQSSMFMTQVVAALILLIPIALVAWVVAIWILN